MPTNQELFIERHVRLPFLAQADAARCLAKEYGLSVDGVRGRLQKADTIKNRVALAKYQANEVDHVPPSVQRQLSVIAKSEQLWALAKRTVAKKAEGMGVFLSDVHAPYTRWDAWELMLQLVEYLQPDYVSAYNDMMDNHAFAHWEDSRSPSGKVWTVDDVYRYHLETTLYKSISRVAPETTLVGVTGNHDNWYFAYHRKGAPSSSERALADYMERLLDLGVLQFTRGYKQENMVDLSPGLKWWHGQYAAKSPVANARNTAIQFMHEGRAVSVTGGHTHRPFLTEGFAIGYPGINIYNSPCMCRLDKLPYMKRAPQGWGLGVTVNRFDPNGYDERGTIVNFREKGNSLVTDFEGKRFSVELDKSAPDDYR